MAEIERENIRTQTMAGREQKAREGKWNGGFAPYGYKLENGNLVIAEDEVEVIRVIYDRYIHTNEGVAGVAKYLNRNGYTKKLRQNNTIPGFSRDFCEKMYCTIQFIWERLLTADEEQKRNRVQETRCTWLSSRSSRFMKDNTKLSFPKRIGIWHREKRKINSFKREKVNNPDHAHILSGILKCPMLRKEYVRQYRQGCTARTRKHGIITTAKIRLHLPGMSAASV